MPILRGGGDGDDHLRNTEQILDNIEDLLREGDLVRKLLPTAIICAHHFPTSVLSSARNCASVED